MKSTETLNTPSVAAGPAIGSVSSQGNGDISSFLPTPQHQKHFYPQIWTLITSFALFAIYVGWDLGLISAVVALDRSYITSVIAGLLLLSSCHAAWHIISYSRQIETIVEHQGISPAFASLPRTPPQPSTATTSATLEIFAEQRRAPVDLGWFLVDLAIRLGLVGTIIGFILIFTSLSDTSIEGANGLKELMIAMSGGMGTALFTTLSGLLAGTLMSFQYLILGRQTEYLIGLVMSNEEAART